MFICTSLSFYQFLTSCPRVSPQFCSFGTHLFFLPFCPKEAPLHGFFIILNRTQVLFFPSDSSNHKMDFYSLPGESHGFSHLDTSPWHVYVNMSLLLVPSLLLPSQRWYFFFFRTTKKFFSVLDIDKVRLGSQRTVTNHTGRQKRNKRETRK